jgi:radical SAM protein with 4Fe4S-binding SPASM domain
MDHARELNQLLADRALKHPEGPVLNLPVHVFLQIVSGCNLDCFMCSEHLRPESEKRGRKLGFFPPELFERLQQATFPSLSGLTLGVGGEPTLSPHFVDYARRASDAGLELDLLTNGSRLPVAEIAEAIGQCFDKVNISLDAATAKTHESIRTGSSWARVLYGLESLAEFRRARPESERSHVTLSFVLMRRNVEELPQLLELAARLGFDAVHAQHLIPVTPGGPAEQLIHEPERCDRVLEVARARAAELGVKLSAPPPFGPEFQRNGTDAEAAFVPLTSGEPIPCSIPRVSVNVLYNGDITPCCHPFAHQRMVLGNLADEDFESIWYGRLATGLRRGLATGDAPELCRRCSIAHGRSDVPLEGPAPGDDWTLTKHFADRNEPEPPLPRQLQQAGLSEFLQDLLEDRSALRSERDGLAAHVANIEADRAGLRAHVANLEDAVAQQTASRPT